MVFRLALRNIASKPLRAAATIVAIAAVVAMIFAMLSFKPAVFEYMLASETAASGDSDIIISTSSSSDRLTTALDGLVDGGGNILVDGVREVVPSFALYAKLGGEYVRVRGFKDGGNLEKTICGLRDIDIYAGSLEGMKSDDAVISRATAKRFGLEVGDAIILSLGANSATLYVKAISENSGYFLGEAPALILGFSKAMSKLLLGIDGVELCNEIYLKLDAGTDADKVIENIKSVPKYSAMLVRRAGNGAAIEEQATSLTAPVVLAGAAVMLLGICVAVLLFMMGEREKLSLISKFTVIGATRGQIFGIFLIEGLLLACAGAALGAGLAVGVFVGILRATLGSLDFTISAGRLLGSVAIGFAVSALGSIVPILRAFSGTVRQNQIGTGKRSRVGDILAAVFAALSIALICALFAGTYGAMERAALGLVTLAVLLVTVGFIAPRIMRLIALSMYKAKGSARVAAYSLNRESRHSRSVTLLSVGMTISMLLFMAWSLTTSIFTSYVSDFKNMAFVTNVKADVDVEEFSSVDGVDTAVAIVWQQGRLKAEGMDRTVTVLGSQRATELTDFAFVTDKNTLLDRLKREEDYVFIDEAFVRLYGIGEGDTLTLEIEGKERQVAVGGILSHRLFDGAYVVASEKTIERLYGMRVDTVAVLIDGDMGRTVGALSEKFSSRNYYVLEVLEAFRWDMQTALSVFDLIGTLAFVVALFIIAVVTASSLVGRAGEEARRGALLNAGMSKSGLLASETLENCIQGLVCFVVAFVASVPITGALIYALALFGLSYEFMFKAWVVALVGIAMAALYAIVPLVFNFKKGYNIKNGRR